jgi:hypothetical protein
MALVVALAATAATIFARYQEKEKKEVGKRGEKRNSTKGAPL